MTAVALIGGDGAGKSTLARALVEDSTCRVKYLYMGLSAPSSNIALPSTRIVYALKVRRERKARRKRGDTGTDPITSHEVPHFNVRRGRLGATARLLNRLAEEAMRQVVSWAYQARGYLVVYDRHFLFEFSTRGQDRRRLSERIHRWLLEHVYPKPHLSILLDAPSEVLYSRKQEVTIQHLDRRRVAYLERGSKMRRFVIIDASQPPDKVREEAVAVITAFLDERATRRSRLLSRRTDANVGGQ